MEVEITYCAPCGFLDRAKDMQSKLQEKFGDDVKVKLIEGEKGIFDVKADGEAVFSRHAAGRFPEWPEIETAIAKRLEAK